MYVNGSNHQKPGGNPPTCRPLGQVQAVCMVHFGTSGSLAGNHLSSVSTAEALILSFFGQHHLLLLLAVASPLQLAAFIVRWRVVLFRRRRGENGHHWCSLLDFFSEKPPASARAPHLWPDAQKAAAVWRSTFTHRLPVPQTLQVVVEGQFCA